MSRARVAALVDAKCAKDAADAKLVPTLREDHRKASKALTFCEGQLMQAEKISPVQRKAFSLPLLITTGTSIGTGVASGLFGASLGLGLEPEFAVGFGVAALGFLAARLTMDFLFRKRDR